MSVLFLVSQRSTLKWFCVGIATEIAMMMHAQDDNDRVSPLRGLAKLVGDHKHGTGSLHTFMNQLTITKRT